MARYFGLRDRLKKRSKSIAITADDVEWIKVATTFSWSPAKRDYQWLEPQDYLSSFLKNSISPFDDEEDGGFDYNQESQFTPNGYDGTEGLVNGYEAEEDEKITYSPPYDYVPPSYDEAQEQNDLNIGGQNADIPAELPLLDEFKLEIVSALQRRGILIESEKIKVPKDLSDELDAYHAGKSYVDSYEIRTRLSKYKRQVIESYERFNSISPSLRNMGDHAVGNFDQHSLTSSIDDFDTSSGGTKEAASSFSSENANDEDYEAYILSSLNRLEASMKSAEEEVAPEPAQEADDILVNKSDSDNRKHDIPKLTSDMVSARGRTETPEEPANQETPSNFADDSWLVLPVDNPKERAPSHNIFALEPEDDFDADDTFAAEMLDEDVVEDGLDDTIIDQTTANSEALESPVQQDRSAVVPPIDDTPAKESSEAPVQPDNADLLKALNTINMRYSKKVEKGDDLEIDSTKSISLFADKEDKKKEKGNNVSEAGQRIVFADGKTAEEDDTSLPDLLKHLRKETQSPAPEKKEPIFKVEDTQQEAGDDQTGSTASIKTQNDEQLELARQEAARLAAEKRQEDERLARLETERLETERLEAARIAEERRLEAQREEAARIAEEKRIEQERLVRLEAERQEAARIAEETRIAEQKRLVEEKRMEEERLAKLEAERQEAIRLAEEKRIEEERLAKLEAERQEAIRLAEEKRIEEERLAKLEAERQEAIRLAEEKRMEEERLAKLEAERQEAIRLAIEKQKEEERLAKIEAEKINAEKLEAQKLEAQKLETQKLEAQQKEAARVAELKRREAIRLAEEKRREEEQLAHLEEMRIEAAKLAEKKRSEKEASEATEADGSNTASRGSVEKSDIKPTRHRSRYEEQRARMHAILHDLRDGVDEESTESEPSEQLGVLDAFHKEEAIESPDSTAQIKAERPVKDMLNPETKMSRSAERDLVKDTEQAFVMLNTQNADKPRKATTVGTIDAEKQGEIQAEPPGDYRKVENVMAEPQSEELDSNELDSTSLDSAQLETEQLEQEQLESEQAESVEELSSPAQDQVTVETNPDVKETVDSEATARDTASKNASTKKAAKKSSDKVKEQGETPVVDVPATVDGVDDVEETEEIEDIGLIETEDGQLDTYELANVLEALAFATEDPIPLKKVARIYSDVLEVKMPTEKMMRAALEVLNNQYAESGRTYRIKEWAGGVRMASHPQYAKFIRALYHDDRPKKLSRTLMETLAIIAYSQPSTKPEVDFVRGVDSDYAVRKLLELGLIDIVGRSESIGRPLLYGTSERFLEQFGLSEIGALPKLREVEDLLGDPAFKKERLELLALEEMESSVDASNGEQASGEEESGEATEGVDVVSAEAPAESAGATDAGSTNPSENGASQ